MRIEAYNQIASIYKTSKTGKVQQPYGVSTGRDEVQISQLGRDYQIAKQAVAEASDIREECKEVGRNYCNGAGNDRCASWI